MNEQAVFNEGQQVRIISRLYHHFGRVGKVLECIPTEEGERYLVEHDYIQDNSIYRADELEPVAPVAVTDLAAANVNLSAAIKALTDNPTVASETLWAFLHALKNSGDEKRQAYEFMRSEVNRLETLLSTARIGLGQSGKYAREVISGERSTVRVMGEPERAQWQEIVEIAAEALKLSE